MAGPWESYAAETTPEGPWTYYGAAKSQSKAKSDEPFITWQGVNDFVANLSTGLQRGAMDMLRTYNTGAQLQNMPAAVIADAAASYRTGRPTTERSDKVSELGQAAPRAIDPLQQKVEEFAPPYNPTTPAGRIVQGGAQAVGGGLLMPGGTTPMGMYANALSGGAGQGAREVFPDSKVAPVVASLLAPIVGAAPFMLRSTPAQIAAGATEGVTDAQWAAAAKLFNDARAAGRPITAAEAIAQVTGGNNLQGVQRVTEQSRRGGPVLQPMMNDRAAANERAFSLTEPGQVRVTDPTGIGPAVKTAAEETMTGTRQAINAQAKPYYDLSSNDPSVTVGRGTPGTNTGGPTGFAKLQADPIVTNLIAAIRKDPILGGQLKGLPDNSLLVLDATKKAMDDAINVAKNGGEFNKVRLLEQARKNLLSVTDDTSAYPQAYNYAEARRIEASGRQNVLGPEEARPIGKLATTDDITQQFGIAFPGKPVDVTPTIIRRTVEQLKAKNPQAARDFLDRFVQSNWDEATQKNVGGTNPYGAAKFNAQVAGNTGQRENLLTAIEAVHGKGARTGFERFLEISEAQGKRLPMGSPTDPNAQIRGDMSAGNASLLMKPQRAVGELYDWWRYGANSAEMARLLTQPDAVAKLRNLALFKPDSRKAALMASEIAAIVRATGEEQR